MEYHVRSRYERDGVSLWRCVTDDVQRRDFFVQAILPPLILRHQCGLLALISCAYLTASGAACLSGVGMRLCWAAHSCRRSFVAKVAYGVAATLTGYACWPQVRRGCLKPVP